MTLSLTEYGFRHSFDCHEVVPPAEANLVRIPPESSAEEGSRLVIGVTPEHGSAWLGAFRRGFDEYLEALLECPDSNSLCVVAGGTAYTVTADDPSQWRELRVIPTVSAMGYGSRGLLFLASFNVVAAFDSAMREAWRADLESDGIEFTGVDERSLAVRAYMPSFGDWIPRSVSLTDGTASEAR
ncbi:MAG: hypothetical protein M3019_03015 [Candidatus Dormibacteraeota bacterium]|nr:hypothetical protein [Candidatus Dormibacteraeota bacterium]